MSNRAALFWVSWARSAVGRALIAIGILVAAVLTPIGVSIAPAAGTPDIALSKVMPAESLAGADIPVTLTVSNPGTVDGFNLTITDILPSGVSYVVGSSDPAPTVEALSDGTTLLVWNNISDSLSGTTVNLGYEISPGSSNDVGSTITNSASAYVNDDTTIMPVIDLATGSASNTTGSDTASAQTELTAFLLEKTSGEAESEQLRGLHANQTAYTLKIENNLLNSTTSFSIVDYLPAELEFLACGGVDNSSAEEYAGSGVINPGNEPTLVNPCLVPSSVTTVTTDPDGTGPLPNDVYTRVEWDAATLATSLSSGGTFLMDYIAAIPLRENVQATLTNTTANLDNNTGSLTTETETEFTNYASASGFYNGSPAPSTDDASLTLTAEDVSIHKSASSETYVQGDTPIYTLLIESSEYATSTGAITVTDTVPSALNVTGATPAVDSPPGQVLNGDGTITVTWTIPAYTAPNSTTTITLNTLVREHYRTGAGGDGAAIAARDSFVNTADLSTTATVLDGNGSTLAVPVVDTSSASQKSDGIVVTKEVSTPVGSLTCGNGTGVTFQSTIAASYRPGDRICYRLLVDFPASMDTLSPVLTDFLPAGVSYQSWTVGATSDLPVGAFTFENNGGRLDWTLSTVDAQALRAEIIVQVVVSDPLAAAPGDPLKNYLKLRYFNTEGAVFQDRDDVDFQWSEPTVGLTKGLIAVNASPLGGPSDNETVVEGDVVTYQVAVSNTGSLDALDVSVRDVLPTGIDCGDVASISHGGACDAANKWIQWDTADDINVAVSATINLTYDVTIPVGTSAGATLTNTAGVRTFSAETNAGTRFEYVPANNIDSTLTANTEAAGDTSKVATAAPTIDKTRTTSITETGNITYQATIGETVSYTVDLVLPNDITFYNAQMRDALDARFDLDHTSVVVTLNGSATLPAGFTVTADDAANSITLDFPATYIDTSTTPPAFKLTFDATVLDDAAIKRPNVPNTAYFDYEDLAGTERSVNDDIDTRVVEPNLTLVKSDDDVDGVASPGQTIAYSVVVGNDNSVSFVSPAHDTVIVDTVPAQLAVDVGSISNGGVYAAGATANDPSTITWTIAKINPGATVTLTYDATTDNPLVASGSLVNTAVGKTTSMAGTVTGERTTLSAGGDEIGEGYLANAQNTINIAGWSIAKTAAPATATIGETVTYTAVIEIPADLVGYDVTVLDDLPTGLGFESLTSVVCVQGAGACTPDLGINDVDVITGGGDVAFFFDDLTTPSSADRTVTITYVAFVTDVSAADSGSTLTNSAKVHWNLSDTITSTPSSPPAAASFDAASDEAKADVGTVEPALTIDKDVGGQTGDTDLRRAKSGDVLTYTITVTNTGNNVAHNATVTDVVTDDTWAFTDKTTASGATNLDANPVGGLAWTIDGPIAASGGTAVITYELVVPVGYDSGDEVVAGIEQANTADVSSYYAVSAAYRTANPSRGFRNYDNVTPDVVGIELDLASLGDLLWLDVDNDGVFDSGEPILANVRVTVTYLGPNGVAGGGDDEVFTTTTGSDGKYLVEGLPAGQYTVDVDETDTDFPAGLTPSYDLDGTTTSPDGAWTGALVENADKRDVDFGYTGTGSIGDTIWLDQNKDGIIDGNEAGIAGVDVTATWFGPNGVAGGGDDVVYTDTTDANGKYLIENLPDGTFRVGVDTGDLPIGLSNVSEHGSENDNSSTATISGGSNELAHDFGYAGTGTIGDTIYLDQNGDGDQDSGEPGLGGVIVELRHFGADGVFGGVDDSTYTTSTAANGSYLFTNLPTGEFEVSVTGALPANVSNSDDPDSASPGDSKGRLTLTSGEINLVQDFGYHATSVLGDRVWWDVDGDGVQETGELGLNGVEVTLTYFGSDGVLGGVDDQVFVTMTSGDGDYLFSNIPDGNYTVAVTDDVPSGFNAGFDEDSGLVSPDETIAISLSSGHLTADFGYVGTGSIGDTIWFDTDADGVLDGDEFGLESVTVKATWYGPDGAPGGGDDLVITTTTDSAGNYTFSGLPAGTFEVAVDTSTLLGGLAATYDQDDGMASPDGSAIVSLTPGQAIDNVDVGYQGSGSVGDTIWLDLDRDGTSDAGEPGIPGVEVTLVWSGPDGVIGTADDVVYPTQTTDADGHYLFDAVPAGPFSVSLDNLPAGVSPTADPDDGAANGSTASLNSDQKKFDQDFGYAGTASVGDLVWLDVNADGVRGPNEPGVGGLPVLVTSAGADGTLGTADDIVIKTTTNADGSYLVTGLPPGPTSVSYNSADLAAGRVPSSDRDADDFTVTTLSLAATDAVRDVDFVVVGSTRVEGTLFIDADGDGVQDPGEVGLAGVSVIITWNGPNGPVATTAVSGPDGTWQVETIPDGDYTVAIDLATLPEGVVATVPTDTTLTIPPGVLGIVFNGFAVGASIGDRVWDDLDGDGIQDPGEPGVGGVVVELRDSAGTLVATTTTDSSGGYRFDGLKPGEYVVELVPSTIPAGRTVGADPDGGNDGSAAVTLRSGDQLIAIDFGLRQPPVLAFTGQEMAWLLVAGTGLLVLGSGFVIASRRRP